MKIQNAIKKIEKNTEVKVKNNNGRYSICKNSSELSFIGDGSGEACCFRTRGLSDIDDSMTDYSAGVFWDNVTQAINSINRS